MTTYNDVLDGPREIEYKGWKIGYEGRFNLIKIYGVPESFTSFAKAQEWVDNPVNANIKPEVVAVADTLRAESAERKAKRK